MEKLRRYLSLPAEVYLDPLKYPKHRSPQEVINPRPEEVDLVSNNFASPLFVPLWPRFWRWLYGSCPMRCHRRLGEKHLTVVDGSRNPARKPPGMVLKPCRIMG